MEASTVASHPTTARPKKAARMSGLSGTSRQYAAAALGRGCGHQLGQIELLKLLLENLARLELNHGTLRNNDFGFRFVRVAADPLFADLNLKHAKVSQFHISPVGQ